MLPPTASGANTSRSSGSCASPERRENAVARRQPELARVPAEEVRQRPVRAGDRLRRARGARGEGDVRQVVGGDGDRGRGRWESTEPVVLAGRAGRRVVRTVSASAAATSAGTSPAAEIRSRAVGRAARTCAARRAGGYAGSRTANAAPAFHAPSSARTSAARAVGVDGHHVARPHPAVDQPVRDAVGRRVQLGVRPRLRRIRDRQRVRRFRRVARRTSRARPRARPRPRSAVPGREGRRAPRPSPATARPRGSPARPRPGGARLRAAPAARASAARRRGRRRRPG